MNESKSLCAFANSYNDYLNLKLSLALKENPDDDLMDQYHELCTHPAEEVRESSCGNYKLIKSKIGNSDFVALWHLSNRSHYNREQRLSRRGAVK